MPDVLLHIHAGPGSGLALGFGDDPDCNPKPEGFPQDYAVVIEELNWYDEEDDFDVIVDVEHVDLSTQVTRHTRPMAFSGDGPWWEVTFSGTLRARFDSDEVLEAFRSHIAEGSVDYSMFFESKTGQDDLHFDDGYAFLWNQNLRVAEVP